MLVSCLIAAALTLGPTADVNRRVIQNAIDVASAAGGGRVEIPVGEWTIGSIELKSGVELHLPEGAVLMASTNRVDYNANDVFPENFHSAGEEWSGGHLVYAYKAENIAITGKGRLDGNGPAFFGDCQFNWGGGGYKYGLKLFPKDREWFRPGPLLAFFMCKNIRLEDVTFANTPCWTCHIRCSDGVSIRGVTIDADRTIANSDGFSIDCSRNVKIDKCVIKTGDDGFAIRAACRHHSATNFCENIVVRDCDIWSCSYGVRLGVGAGTIRNVVFEDCRFHESVAGVVYSPAWVAGERNVHIEKTRFTRCRFAECDRPVDVQMPDSGARVKNALFEDCCFESLLPCKVEPRDRSPIEDFRFVRCVRKTLFDGWKVRQDCVRLWKMKPEIRRDSDLLVAEGSVAKCTDCLPSRESPHGVLLLTFDDRNFDNWIKAMPIFDKYGAHATFFVCGEIDNPVVTTMKRLRSHGHSIGLHGFKHADATNEVARLGGEAYYMSEIHRQKRACEVGFVPITAFAYPNCRRNEETDRLLWSKGFERVRGGSLGTTPYDPDGKRQKDRRPLVACDGIYFPAAELPVRRMLNTILVGEAYRTDIEEIKACLERVAKNREVFTIASHGIYSNAHGIDMKTEWLEEILKTAKDLDLRVIGFDELPPPQ